MEEIKIILIGAAPIFEVRGAIPAGLFVYGFSPFKAWALGCLGNLLPVLPGLFVLTRFSEYLMRHYYFINRFLSWLYERVRQKHNDHFEAYGFLPFALFVFVAIPLPLTGVYSGIVAAVVFGVPLKKAALSLSAGVLAAGLAVLLLSLLGSQAVRIL